MNFDVVGFLMVLLPSLYLFLTLVLLDLITGVVRAVMNKVFHWEVLPSFLLTASSYLLAWVIAEVLAVLPLVFGIEVSGYSDVLADVAPKVVYVFVVMKYVASLVGHIKYFLSYGAES